MEWLTLVAVEWLIFCCSVPYLVGRKLDRYEAATEAAKLKTRNRLRVFLWIWVACGWGVSLWVFVSLFSIGAPTVHTIVVGTLTGFVVALPAIGFLRNGKRKFTVALLWGWALMIVLFVAWFTNEVFRPPLARALWWASLAVPLGLPFMLIGLWSFKRNYTVAKVR